MGYQRAKWHSNLTYYRTCWKCGREVMYQDDALGFRWWFPDGFVYCPDCKSVLRHSESYAMIPQNPLAPQAPFCTQCGEKSNPGDIFCIACGKKLEK